MRRTRSAWDCRKSRAVCNSTINLSMSAIEAAPASRASSHGRSMSSAATASLLRRTSARMPPSIDAASDSEIVESCSATSATPISFSPFRGRPDTATLDRCGKRLLNLASPHAARGDVSVTGCWKPTAGRKRGLPIVICSSSDRTLEHPSLPHTPITILTGFLGSGKTTLLNRALRDPAMANTAVVINEFGEVGLDHALAAQSDDTIMVLENGCLCCTVFGDLVPPLNNLSRARGGGEFPLFDHVVIEPSGLADPSPLTQAFLSAPVWAGFYRTGFVVAPFDAVNGPATLDNH